jgi:hypothetical protein
MNTETESVVTIVGFPYGMTSKEISRLATTKSIIGTLRLALPYAVAGILRTL